MPKSCSASDVKEILNLDPHANMLKTFSAVGGEGDALKAANDTQTANNIFQIRVVRKVPGSYVAWRELKFQIFV